MAKVPLFFRIDERLAERVRADARRANRTLDACMTAILNDFLSSWNPSERAAFYAAQEPKIKGRPQAAQTKTTVHSD